MALRPQYMADRERQVHTGSGLRSQLNLKALDYCSALSITQAEGSRVLRVVRFLETQKAGTVAGPSCSSDEGELYRLPPVLCSIDGTSRPRPYGGAPKRVEAWSL